VGFARSVFIIDWLLTVLLISGCRFSVRFFFQVVGKDDSVKAVAARFFPMGRPRNGEAKNLLIIGAGDFGEKIYREIQDNAGLKYNIVGFVDDDKAKIGKQIHGTPIMGPTSEIRRLAERLHADEALITISSVSSQRMRAIVSACENSGLTFKTLPGMGELIGGKVSVRAIRDVAYRDLLGREVIHLEEKRIGSYLRDSCVMVSGAGGSIGSELCRQICRFRPSTLLLYDQAESPLYDIEIELKKNFPDIAVVPLLADIRNRRHLTYAFETYGPQVVFHAAAYKHVPMLEMHPWEAVTNNIVGTRNMVDFASRYGVDKFVLVSTDKAVRPANVMGASKRAAELLVQGQNACNLSGTRYITVRFGNVVGSVGSVVPLFKKQIEKGGPVTVTHPDVIRYFMTIPESCQLILQAGAMGEGGEIFILDMGRPVRILDMAKDLIAFSGFEPNKDIKIEFIGLRPGEKLYEELITEGENIVPTRHQKIMVLRGQSCNQTVLNGSIDAIQQLARKQDGKGIRLKLKEIVPEYMPKDLPPAKVAGGKEGGSLPTSASYRKTGTPA
jgi:FlaA1/EpsC-like NDP-sugar epimerase